jgi:lipopolysaccharide export system permease protein
VTSLDRYLFRQCLVPFAVATGIVTAIIWMTQSLQRADIMVEHGQSAIVFARLSLLILPSLIAVIIPFALFAGALYALQRMHADSEIAVMHAAGMSRLRIGAPLLLIAGGAAAATLWVNLELMPSTYRMLKREIADIRADIANAVLRSGEFITVADGFTIYVESAAPNGRLEGLLVSDYRNSGRAETYMAQRGYIQDTPAGPVLQLANGNIQRVSPTTGQIDIVRFEKTVLNLETLAGRRGELQLETTERFLPELLNPDPANDWDRANAAILIAEGHNRLASPLYVFAFALIALVPLIGGAYNRRGYGARIAIACLAAGGLRVAGVFVQTLSARAEAYWLQYALPLAATLVLFVLLVRGVGGGGKARAGALD